jgi:SOS-response transcriptional repressor LexA
MQELTKRQEDTLLVIRTLITTNKRSPTLREIGNSLGISAPAAKKHVDALEEKGYIEREAERPRSIRIAS